jgi:hypothetical protein
MLTRGGNSQVVNFLSAQQAGDFRQRGIDNVKSAEDVFDLEWENWGVYPTQDTKLVSIGEATVLYGTNFSEFERIGNEMVREK